MCIVEADCVWGLVPAFRTVRVIAELDVVGEPVLIDVSQSIQERNRDFDPTSGSFGFSDTRGVSGNPSIIRPTRDCPTSRVLSFTMPAPLTVPSHSLPQLAAPAAKTRSARCSTG